MTKILVDREVLQDAVEILATLMHCVPSNEPELRRDTSAMAHSIRTLLDQPDAQPKSFIRERAQLEQEWCELRKLKQAQQVKRVPMTDEEIDAIMQPLTQNTAYSWRAFSRAIEAAHGIGKGEDT